MTINNILYYIINIDLLLFIKSLFPLVEPLVGGIAVVLIYAACQAWLIDWVSVRTNGQGWTYKICWVLIIVVWITIFLGSVILMVGLWNAYQLPNPHLLKFDLIKK